MHVFLYYAENKSKHYACFAKIMIKGILSYKQDFMETYLNFQLFAKFFADSLGSLLMCDYIAN